jgi:hypothetical protein
LQGKHFLFCCLQQNTSFDLSVFCLMRQEASTGQQNTGRHALL